MKIWKKKKRIMTIVIGGILASMLLVGCGNKQETSSGQEEEKIGGELNLFTWDGMFPREVLSEFEEEYGVQINYANFDFDEDM